MRIGRVWSRARIGAAHVQAGHAGQHQVQHHDVRTEGPQPLQPLLAGLGGGDLVALAAQGEGDTFPHGAVVFDQQNAWHALSIRTPSARSGLCYRMITWAADPAGRYHVVTIRARIDHIAITI